MLDRASFNRPKDIYHVTVMPCYDKKLEAAREEFVFQVDSDTEKITEVDSVLTTGEVLDLIQVKRVLCFSVLISRRVIMCENLNLEYLQLSL